MYFTVKSYTQYRKISILLVVTPEYKDNDHKHHSIQILIIYVSLNFKGDMKKSCYINYWETPVNLYTYVCIYNLILIL